jgi:hypothetical protein
MKAEHLKTLAPLRRHKLVKSVVALLILVGLAAIISWQWPHLAVSQAAITMLARMAAVFMTDLSMRPSSRNKRYRMRGSSADLGRPVIKSGLGVDSTRSRRLAAR